MDVKQKYIVAPKKITLSIDFIEQLEKSDLVKWENIVSMIERIDNRRDKAEKESGKRVFKGLDTLSY